MSRAIARRLAALEGRLAPLRRRSPAAEFAWLTWCSVDELLELERLAEAVHFGRELTAAEKLRAVELEAAATRRMLVGEPPG
jgi:hypothetical protein